MLKKDDSTIDSIDLKVEQFIQYERQNGRQPPTPFEKTLIRTVAFGNQEEFFSLLTQQPNQDSNFWLSLRACAFFGQLPIIKALGHPPSRPLSLKIAAEMGHLDIVDCILGHQVPISPQDLEYALCIAARNGHLKVVNCMIKKHKLNPNNPNKLFADPLQKGVSSISREHQISDALYLAAKAGQVDVVLTLLNDPRTGYYNLKKLDYNSPNEKAYILALAVLCKVLLDKTIDPMHKRKTLFITMGKLLARGQDEYLRRIFKFIGVTVKKELITSCYGKQAPSEMIGGDLVDFFYEANHNHTEVQLLLASEVGLSDGRLSLVFDKEDRIYKRHYSSDALGTKLDLKAELNHLIPVLGFEFSVLDMDSVTFSPKSSRILREVNCLHYNFSYLMNLINVQSGLRLYYDFYSSMRQDPFWLQVPKEIWNIIGDYFMRVLHNFGLNDVDSTDMPYIFETQYPDPSPTQLLLPPNEDGTQSFIEVPLEEKAIEESRPLPETKAPLDKITILKVIYTALYNGQSSFFKQWNSDLMDKQIKNEKMITAYIAKNPKSRTAKAWDLTNDFIEGNLNKTGLFQEIHREAYKNSSSLGIFKQSVFEKDFTGMHQRILKAKRDELKNTRTQDIVEALDMHPALKL